MLHALLVVCAAALPIPTEDPAPKAPAAPDERAVRDALKRAGALLVDAQETYVPKRAAGAERKTPSTPKSAKPREWPYEGVYRVAGDIPIGYRVGGTAIVATALVEAADGEPKPDARAAIEAGLDFVLEGLRDDAMSADFVRGYDVRGWGHAYALGFLLRLREAKLVPEKRAAEVESAIDVLVARLAETEIGERGGWNYSRPSGADSPASTFMTAPTLLFLYEARRQGEAVDAAVVERALKTLEDARLDTSAFQYATNPASRATTGGSAVEGSVGRMAVCEVALHLAGRGSVDRVRGSIAAFFEHWQHLEDRRKKTGTHVPPYMVAPYYFYFAHRYVAQAIEFLPEGERASWRDKLRVLLWKVREDDGGWNDRVFPRSASFGTAMTVMALREPSMTRPAGWSAKTDTGGNGAR